MSFYMTYPHAKLQFSWYFSLNVQGKKKAEFIEKNERRKEIKEERD